MATGVDLSRKNCEYFRVCGGGAGSNKFWENGIFASAENSACKYRIKLVTESCFGRVREFILLGIVK